jgi:hypothetical protein
MVARETSMRGPENYGPLVTRLIAVIKVTGIRSARAMLIFLFSMLIISAGALLGAPIPYQTRILQSREPMQMMPAQFGKLIADQKVIRAANIKVISAEQRPTEARKHALRRLTSALSPSK